LARADQIDSDARLRAREHLERAREQAQHILEVVTKHADSLVQNAEVRTRELRIQEQELHSFTADVSALIRVALPEKRDDNGASFEAAVEDELAALIARVDPTRIDLPRDEDEVVEDESAAEADATDTDVFAATGDDLDSHAVVDEDSEEEVDANDR
jgi:hypothetical protein